MEYTYLFVLTGVEPSSLTCNTSGCFQMLGDLVLYSSQGPSLGTRPSLTEEEEVW